MDENRLRTLEERFLFLERHVAEQDRAMLGMAERIDKMEARLRLLQERLAAESATGGADPSPPDAPPPHY
jgi:uncharacterized coiled-coil protein SlyX